MKKQANFLVWVLVSCFTLMFGSTNATAQKIPLKIGGGSIGGTWFPMMTATMVVVNEEIPEVISTVVPGGALVNVRKMDKGEMDLGLTYVSSAYEAWEGIEPFKKKLKNIRAIGTFTSHPYSYAVPADSSVYSIKDLHDKRLAVGKKGSGTELAFKRLLGEYGITYDSIRKEGGKVHLVGYGQGCMLLKDRHLDVSVFDGIPPDPKIVEVETAFPVRVIGIEKEVVDRLLKKYPGYKKFVIPAGCYKGHNKDALTIGWETIVITRADLGKDLVYKITKAIYENPERLGAGFAELKTLDARKAVEGIPIPMHPGAERYFKEKGIKK